jgi:hypothetical protein
MENHSTPTTQLKHATALIALPQQPYEGGVMDSASLSQLVNQINQQTNTQENLKQRLAEAEALTQVLMATDFLDFSKSTMFNYVSAINEIVTQSKLLSEQMFDALLELKILAKNY